MEGTSNAGFLRQLPSLKFQSPSPALCHRFLNGDGLVTQKEKGKKKKTPTLEATHVGPFTPHFSFPKYPSPLLPRTFPSVCIFLSLHPPFSPALRLIDSTTKCLWQMTRISERNGETLELELEHLSGRIEPPHHLFLCVDVSSREGFSVSIFDIRASSHTATDRPTIRSRDFSIFNSCI